MAGRRIPEHTSISHVLQPKYSVARPGTGAPLRAGSRSVSSEGPRRAPGALRRRGPARGMRFTAAPYMKRDRNRGYVTKGYVTKGYVTKGYVTEGT